MGCQGFRSALAPKSRFCHYARSAFVSFTVSPRWAGVMPEEIRRKRVVQVKTCRYCWRIPQTKKLRCSSNLLINTRFETPRYYRQPARSSSYLLFATTK
jgi:hypothetical protein